MQETGRTEDSAYERPSPNIDWIEIHETDGKYWEAGWSKKRELRSKECWPQFFGQATHQQADWMIDASLLVLVDIL